MANTIRWDTETMETIAQRLNRLSRELASCKSAVRSIANRMDQESGGQLDYGRSVRLSMAGMRVGDASVKSCLRQYANALDRYDSLSSQLATNLKNAAQEIESSERSFCKLITNTGSESPFANGNSGNGGGSSSHSPSGAGSSSSENSEKREGFSWKDLALDILGEAGIVGSITSGLLGLNGSAESLLKLVVKGTDSAVKWSKLVDKKELFGLDKYLKNPSKLTSKWGAFKQNFTEGFKNGMTNPVSWITAGITSAFSNYEEFGTSNIDRAIVEWGAETGLTVLAGAGTSALVGAAFAAAGIAAPAVAVGAVATIVYAGVDALWKNTIGDGKSLVESAGHLVGEVYEGAKEVVGDIYDGAKEVVTDTYKAAKKVVTKTVDKAKKWVGDKIDSIKNGFNISALWA